MARGKGSGKGKGKAKGALRAAGATKAVDRDVYSDDETEREQKEARMNAAVDVDGVYEYEQPETFEHDSEISEDEAFNSDDEEQFGMFFQQKKKLHMKQEEAEETEEEADEEEEDEGNLLSDLLGTAPAARLSTIATGNGDADDDVFDDEDDEEEDDETVAAKSKNLRSLVDTLVPAKKKKKLEEITDATIMASASRARSDSSDAGELTLATLLGGGGEDDDNSEATATATSSSKVKKQIRELEADAAASGPLSSTIAPVLEERAARKLAYEQKKEQVDLFQPVVRRNRQKETMDFREQIPKMENLTAAGLASKFSAETDLEKDVAALLQAGGLSDRAIAQDEHDELVQKKVSVDEVLTRQKELSKMRALMFYDEQKAKRVKKIKSKLYHKIRNAQDKKQQEKQHAQLRALDPELAKQLDDELAEKRAEERLTLKHTNTSKWVKHQLKRGIHADQGTRNAIADQLRRGDELRRKMQTVHSDDEDDGGDDGYSSGEEEGGPVDAATRLQRRLERQADALVTEIDGDQASAGELKGLAGMKFMQRAVQKQRQKARDEAEKLLREIKGENALLSDGDDASSDDGEATTKKKRKHKKQKTQAVAVTDADKAAVAKALPRGALQTGSVSMDKGLSARAAGTIAVDLGDGATTQATTVDVSQGLTTGATVEIGAKKSRSADKLDATEAAEPTATEENPWLTGAATKNKKKHKKAKKSETQSGGVDVAHAMDALTKSVGKPSQGAHLDIAKSAATAVAGTKRKQAFETAADQPTAAPVDESSKKKNATNKKAKITQAEQDKLTQDELVRRAFAFADEGENELQQEKEAIAGQDTQAKKGAEIAKLVGMVGWGSWAGEGVQKSYRQTQREEMAAKLAAATKQQVLQSRKDSKMERVLINEKKDKRAAKFAVDEVPYPFTSREEYEMAMRNPLGGDWNTPSATNALTKPKVMLRAGQMLDPLRLSKEDKKQAKKELTKKRKAKF